ncbi:zinc-binding dehydrogenase [Priestia megaterium]|uniref:zinc-binding dehydrogenase n=1 Tax=Priestia megaterium TaxID=1404 RepID=UPI000BFA067D|nr:zinc-binding dehydrogenase [Priestia megaterium]MED3969050.1 zinc-binding dehydrogenase [Priestia megaterium]PFO15201.1 zinc-binding alcohol dehydrogenase [Priestia megaterium]PFV95390.1 zinc-binding alcohol dehydrogenase [Priestia megaterium]PGT72467.1 zinc-binding alcohol dehydrogenase [Priestia megaterium]
MKALLLQDKNKWTEMKVEEIEKPLPNKGEVVVEVHAVGLNPVDYKTATNGNTHWTYPHILGLDVAGTIDAVGEGVVDWKKGDRVVYHGDFMKKGGYAEYAVTTAHSISRIPDAVTFEEAAALPTAGYTAYEALFRKLPMNHIQTILIHGGAGGVGGFGVQLAKNAGKTVFSTASAHNHEYVKSLGADYVIDYREENVVEKVLELTNGRGVDAVLDTVSAKNATDSLDMIAYRGHLAHIAGAPDYTKVKPFTKVISYHEVALNAAHHIDDMIAQADLAKMGDELLALVAEKKVAPMIERIISLKEVPSALEELSKRHVKGKIITKVK